MTASRLAWLRENPQRLARLTEFNFHPARYVHRDHLTGIGPAALVDRLLTLPHGESAVSELLLRRSGMAHQTCWDFDTDRQRLALMEGESLVRLADFLTVAVCHRQLTKIIDKSTRQKLKSMIATDAWDFAAKRASTLTTSEWPADGQEPGDPLPLTLFMRQSLVAAWCEGEPAAIRRRLTWKLPPACSDSVREPTPAQSEFLWSLTRKLLRTDFRAEWTSCSV